MRTLPLLAGLALLAACSDPTVDAERPDAPPEAPPAEDIAQGEDTAASDLPGVDIYIADLGWVGSTPAVSGVRNVTARPGYDNQPAFTADGTGFYFAAAEADFTDIWHCNPDCSERTRITNTPEAGEFSPRPTPGPAARCPTSSSRRAAMAARCGWTRPGAAMRARPRRPGPTAITPSMPT